jgi:hypothetical protein
MRFSSTPGFMLGSPSAKETSSEGSDPAGISWAPCDLNAQTSPQGAALVGFRKSHDRGKCNAGHLFDERQGRKHALRFYVNIPQVGLK